MKEKIREEIYKYVNTLDMSSEEISVIDTYITDMLDMLTPIIDMQEDILSDDKKINDLKQLILANLGDSFEPKTN
jgi:hypothetical protein